MTGLDTPRIPPMNIHRELAATPLLPVVTVATLRALERRHAKSPLMERAGAAAADIAAAMIARSGGRIVVLAGPGNNGGDAYVCARCLHERKFDVAVVTTGDAAQLPADAAAAFAKLAASDVRILGSPAAERPALVVDGLFGVGLSRPPGDPYGAWIEWANASGAPILALDVPSGLDAATGVARSPVAHATATATFIALKPGLLTCDGPDCCGDLSVHALGLDDIPATGVRLEWPGIAATLPEILARRRRNSHKGTFGSVCIVGGAEGLVGAAILAGRAAIRLGAGRVVVALVARDPPLVDAGSPELMLRGIDAVDVAHDAWVLGPGLGTGERAHALVEKIAAFDRPLVVDADALNAIAADASHFAAVARRAAPTVATPHPAEAARLLKCTVADVQADRVAAALQLAAQLHAHVVLKGAGSVVARPDGTFDINATGNPALSTAGSGDVLAGMLGALLAQRIDAGTALRIAVCLHGAAADALVARGIGPVGVAASEVIDAARDLLNEATRAPARR